MHKLLWVIGCAALTAIVSSHVHADVIFDFYQTGVSGNCNIIPGCGPITPVAPVSILRMTLSNTTETGSATFAGYFSNTPPVVTDPNFGLAESYPIYAPPFTAAILPPDFGWPGCTGCGAFPYGYSISWGAEDGQLLGVGIAYTAINDEAYLGLTGGKIGSDGAFGPYCGNEVCEITGYWALVPEASSASLVLGALSILGLVSGLMRLGYRQRGRARDKSLTTNPYAMNSPS